MRFRYLFWLCMPCVVLFACKRSFRQSSDVPVKRAFYKWSSGLLDKQDDSLLRKLDVQRMYIHLFDVDIRETYEPYPIDIVSFYNVTENLDSSIELVPTIFITNRTLAGLTDSTTELLAQNIERKIRSGINKIADYKTQNDGQYAYEWNYFLPDHNMRALFIRDSLRKIEYNKIKEIQFDCDWTPSTKDTYFSFLVKMKDRFHDKQLSATIRLYGYKYPDKAGVPPVDKGMLMCYNAGDVRNMETVNSIFDKKEIKRYLEIENPYPLKLDYAFPIFEWCTHYRNGKLQSILPASPSFFENNPNYTFRRNIVSGLPMYEAQEENVIGYTSDAILVKQGDIVKIEQPDLDDVADIVSMLGKQNKNPQPVITLYDYTFNTVIKHEKPIEKIYRSF